MFVSVDQSVVQTFLFQLNLNEKKKLNMMGEKIESKVMFGLENRELTSFLICEMVSYAALNFSCFWLQLNVARFS